MNETGITLQGWLGQDVTVHQVGDATLAKFRVASTPRRFRRSSGDWVDGPTQWFTVNAWRTLGEHCARSLRRGDPVMIQGRLNASTWVNRDNVEVTTYEIEASAVGHDLNRGVSSFARAQRSEAPRADAPADRAPAGGAADDSSQPPEASERAA
jgi:single-strand DNA-binding protein